MRKVLIVDDDPFIRKLIATTLEDVAGFELLQASDGAEAVDIAAREKPEIVFLDVDMPRLDGIDACVQLRAHDATSGATIVMMTATSRSDNERRAEDAGADLFLTKPFSPLDLLRLVDQLGLLIAYLGLGSNVGDRRGTLTAAAEAVGAQRMSSLYETAPQGEVLDQPDFLNAVVEIEPSSARRSSGGVQGTRVRARPPRGRRPARPPTDQASTSCCSATSSTSPSGCASTATSRPAASCWSRSGSWPGPGRRGQARRGSGPARAASSIIAPHAARDRRRQHADPHRDVPGRRARGALAASHHVATSRWTGSRPSWRASWAFAASARTSTERSCRRLCLF